MAVDVSVQIGTVKFPSPLFIGSFDALTDVEVLCRCFDLCGDSLGAVVTKSTTLDPRVGYAEPKVAAFGGGYLVASGNANPGIAAMATHVRGFKSRHPDRVVLGSIVSDADYPQRNPPDEYGQLALAYADAGVEGVELNLSCPHLDPNDRERTIVPAQDGEAVSRIVGEVKSRLQRAGHDHCLVMPKLTGWNCNPVDVALAAEAAGADAVTLSNLFPGTGYYTGLDGPGSTSAGYEPGDHLLGHGKGAYSGKAMHAAVLLLIETMVRHVHIPVVGSGGCAADLDSLVQSFMAGAIAVEAVTPFYFRNDGEMDVLHAVADLLDGLREYLAEHELKQPSALYHLRRHHDRV